MTPNAPPQASEARSSAEVEFTQEVRFAVVMYGGISLAVYMNGVAQEMLKLVRATAPAQDGTHAHLPFPKGAERVYRKLGQLLDRDAPDGLNERVKALIESGQDVPAELPLRTRCVIDILTGSSAGGINAVYLAKALANNQSLEDLKGLWIKEGEIKSLLNDKQSDENLGLGLDKPPRALFNSRRIYFRLLAALRGMETELSRVGQAHYALADELDLYVTATDMRGLPIPLKLTDKVASELRHRNVFHFRYRTPQFGNCNDFGSQNNPFLAFAARCTSAHPASFEAMQLADIKEVLDRRPCEQPEFAHTDEQLYRFYRKYLRVPATARNAAAPPAGTAAQTRARAEAFWTRSFNDGGVLDNKPFTYALDQIPLRHAALPVDRKLLYIEPGPDDPLRADRNEVQARPDFVSNALLSLSPLPRYQTIVEDLVRVLERNRLLARVKRILSGLDHDEKAVPLAARLAAAARQRTYRAAARSPEEETEIEAEAAPAGQMEREQTLEELIKERGAAWAGYHRLRVATTTDDLTLLVARAAGFDEESDELLVIRDLVRVWRQERYQAYPKGAQRSEQEFLNRYDLQWAIRLVRFVLSKVDELTRPGYRNTTEATPACKQAGVPEAPQLLSEERLQPALRELKGELNEALMKLRAVRYRLWAPRFDDTKHPLQEQVAALGITGADLNTLLATPDEPTYQKRLQETLAKLDAPLDALYQEVRREITGAIKDVLGDCARILYQPAAPHADAQRGEAREAARRLLRYYYDRFTDYDQIAFPLLYSTDVGEELDQVEVFRISPEDATALSPERDPVTGHVRAKLAGTTLGYFGAFFEAEFRINDILWGQLDGAERLITALLPNSAHQQLRATLIAEAHRAIIAEERPALVAAQPPGAPADLLARFQQDFTARYDEIRRFEPQASAQTAGRASRVFGRMLDGYAAARGLAGQPALKWTTRLFRWFAGLIEVATPDSLPNLFFHHWLHLLYLFEVLLIVLGMFLSRVVWRTGVLALAATVIAHSLVLLLGDWMRERRWRKLAFLLLALAVVVIIVLALPDRALDGLSRGLQWLKENNLSMSE